MRMREAGNNGVSIALNWGCRRNRRKIYGRQVWQDSPHGYTSDFMAGGARWLMHAQDGDLKYLPYEERKISQYVYNTGIVWSL